jgi:hypothetical protein
LSNFLTLLRVSTVQEGVFRRAKLALDLHF